MRGKEVGLLLGCELFIHPKPKEVDDGLVGLASGGSTRGRNPPSVKSAKECLPRTHAVSCHGRRPGAYLAGPTPGSVGPARVGPAAW
ncbi:hypothetical protein OIU84_029546, partial [Salix udensis]